MTRSDFYNDLHAYQAQQARRAAIEARLAAQRAAKRRAKRRAENERIARETAERMNRSSSASLALDRNRNAR